MIIAKTQRGAAESEKVGAKDPEDGNIRTKSVKDSKRRRLGGGSDTFITPLV